MDFPPVLILAGGLGTRLSAITGGLLPKSMAPVNGRPFIGHQLELLKSKGVKDVVVCVAHKSESIIDYVGDGTKFGVKVRYSFDNPDGELIGTGGAVLKASQLSGSPFATLYGDSWLDISFAAVFEAFTREKKPALMTVFENDNRWAPSNMLVKDRVIYSYNKENPSADMKHIEFGLTLFNDAAFDSFKGKAEGGNPLKFDLNDVTKDLIARNALGCFEVDTRFYEIGSPAALQELEEHLQKRNVESD